MIAFSVDLEDWYHGIELPYATWPQYERRLEKGMDQIMALLDKHNTKATFFTLGWIGEQYPKLIRQLCDAGHEMASHGFSHEKVYDLSPDAFRQEIRRTKAILEDAGGTAVTAFRAPFFSITEKSLWALEILAQEGYTVDCSISPVKTWRYGIPSTPDTIFRIPEANIIEFPVSTFRLLNKRLGIGGAYFRLFPYFLTKKGLHQRHRQGLPQMFYIHPWEYDPQHPVVPLEPKARITHYTGLKNTVPFTDRMLGQFEFGTVAQTIAAYQQKHGISNVSLATLAA